MERGNALVIRSHVFLQGLCFGGPGFLPTLFYTPSREGCGKSGSRLLRGMVSQLGPFATGIHCSLKPEEKGTGSLPSLKPASPFSSGICPRQEPWKVILMISSLSSIFLFSLSIMSKFIYISEESGGQCRKRGDFCTTKSPSTFFTWTLYVFYLAPTYLMV